LAGVREARADRFREQILDATATQLVNGGFGSERLLSAIAREAGISRPTLYRYFESFDAIRDALIQRELARLLEQVLPVIDELEWTTDSIVGLVTFAVHYARSHPLFEAAIRDVPDILAPQLTSQATSFVPVIVAVLEPHFAALIEQGRIPDIDIPVAIDLLSRIVLSLAFTNTTFDAGDPDGLADYLGIAVRIIGLIDRKP